MTFHHPSIWLLLLLLLTPLLWWRWASERRRAAIAFSGIGVLRRAGSTWAVKARWALPVLRTLAVVLLIISLARPQKPNEQSRIYTEGIAIQLVVDRSSSMAAKDFSIDGKNVDRLTAVRAVVRDFIAGDDELEGRPDDLIGIITFARFADSQCPMTLDHDHLLEVVDQSRIVTDREEDGTAIGDAIALAVERLHDLEQRADITGRHRIKSKVLVLLTDGENNRGDIDPLTAAQMAAAFDIKIYTIGAGSARGFAPIDVTTPFGTTVQRNVPVRIDEEKLRQIAAISGGAYFRATGTHSLRDIYARIDELEKTTIEQRRYLQFSRPAIETVRVGRLTLPPLLAVVFVLLALEMALAQTRLRTLP